MSCFIYTDLPELVVVPNSTFEVDAGATVTYVCVGFSQDEPPNIFWQFGDEQLTNDSSSLVTVYENQVMENGLVFTESILELCSVEVENAGLYSCTANNTAGSSNSTFTLNVRPRSKRNYHRDVLSKQFIMMLLSMLLLPPHLCNLFVLAVPPSIVIRPNVTEPFMEGNTVQLVCTATGRPYPMIQWYKDGVLITNDTSSLTSIYNEEFENNGLLFTSSILEVCSVGAENRGRYSCLALNAAGNDSIEFDVQVMLGMSLYHVQT